MRVPHADQIARLEATRSLAQRLRRALEAEDAERVARLLKRFRSGASERRPRRRARAPGPHPVRTPLQPAQRLPTPMPTESSRASTSRFAERAARCALAALAALLCGGAPAARAQAPLPPSLSIDQAFAPSTGGVARDGGDGTGTDIPSGVAVYGDRIYTVGESNGEVAIIARRSNGTLDSGFGGGDGRVDLAIGNGKDVGMAIVALPDGRLRVLAKYDADTRAARTTTSPCSASTATAATTRASAAATGA